MMLFVRCTILLALIIFVASAGNAWDESSQEDIFTHFLNQAKSYALTSPSGELRLKTTPVFRWTNPARTGGQTGAVYVWTRNERPEALGCCFQYFYNQEPREKHEFHSLATEPLNAAIGSESVWHPPVAGLEFVPVPDAGTPATSEARRAFQMRQIARRFQITIEDSEGGSAQLRLLSKPLYSYEPNNGPCSAGALFAFAQGTDPDALLVIESRKAADGELQWHWALARYHYDKLSATLDDQQVWSVPAHLEMMTDIRSQSQFRESVYVSFKPR